MSSEFNGARAYIDGAGEPLADLTQNLLIVPLRDERIGNPEIVIIEPAARINWTHDSLDDTYVSIDIARR